MFDGKFIATMLAILISVFAICNFNTKKITSHEGFGMNPSGTYKLDRQAADSKHDWAKGDIYSVPPNYQAMANPTNYHAVANPNYQSSPPPRFANVNFGANIRYNMPKEDYQATPLEPLTFGNMARENFETNRYTTPTCGKAGSPLIKENYGTGTYSEIADTMTTYPKISDFVPVSDMSTVNSLGETVQPIVYDRFIYANRNSRLRRLGDPIRGDLAIVPSCSGEWFRPSVHPVIDLQQGAMNVMGGLYNSTANELAELIYNTSRSSTIGGIDISTEKNVTQGQFMNSVQVNSFA